MRLNPYYLNCNIFFFFYFSFFFIIKIVHPIPGNGQFVGAGPPGSALTTVTEVSIVVSVSAFRFKQEITNTIANKNIILFIFFPFKLEQIN